MADFLSLSDIQSLRISLPSLEQQAGVADLLGALDEKFAVNERIAATSDALRSALLTDALAQGTRLIPLSAIADFINGRAFTKQATGTGRMVVRIAEINSGPGSSTVFNELDVADVHLARPGDVLFAWSGSLTVARWYRSEAIINQHIFKVIPKVSYTHWLAFELIKLALAKFRAIAADKATTMGHIQRRHLDEVVAVPDSPALASIEKQAKALWDRALAAEVENLQLAKLRDTLLPKLMSGELRVRDAEQIVGEAT